MTSSTHEWRPGFAPELPVALRIGTVGLGVGVGCGVGIGFGRSLMLGSIPVLGQAAQGVSAGLGGLLGPLAASGGGAAAAVRQAVGRLGVRGLDAGLGCGVGIGYGWGAGLVVKPSALEQLLGGLSRAVSSRLQQAGISLPQGMQPTGAAPATSGLQAPLGMQPPFGGQGAINSVLAAPAAGGGGGVTGAAFGRGSSGGDSALQGQEAAAGRLLEAAAQQLAASGASVPAGDGAGGQQAMQDPLVLRSLLQLQGDVAQLRRQSRQLRRAVCRLDPKLPLCDASSNQGQRRGRRRGGGGSSDGGGGSSGWSG